MSPLHLIDSETERTTSATDAVLALASLAAVIYILTLDTADTWKQTLALAALICLSAASVLGAVAHGFEWSEQQSTNWWRPLYLSLGIMIAVVSVIAIDDLWGRTAARQALWPVIGIGLAFFVVTQIREHSFLMFVLFESVALLFALGGYGWLWLSGRLTAAPLMVAGLLITLIAAAIQATKRIKIRVIWEFDHNGVFHVIQLFGLVFLTLGLGRLLT